MFNPLTCTAWYAQSCIGQCRSNPHADQIISAFLSFDRPLFIILQQQFDLVVLSTMQATVHTSALFFALIMVLGGVFLLEYVTAILCITYGEITVSGKFSENADQTQTKMSILLTIAQKATDRR